MNLLFDSHWKVKLHKSEGTRKCHTEEFVYSAMAIHSHSLYFIWYFLFAMLRSATYCVRSTSEKDIRMREKETLDEYWLSHKIVVSRIWNLKGMMANGAKYAATLTKKSPWMIRITNENGNIYMIRSIFWWVFTLATNKY